jgi:hypothetical protein
LRTLLAVLALLASFVIAVAVAEFGDMSRSALLASFICMMIGFASLRLACGRGLSARPMQLTLGFCCLITVAMLAGTAWPPAHDDLAGWFSLFAILTLVGAGLVLFRRRPAMTALLLALPALDSLWALFKLAQTYRAPGGIDVLGPSETLAYYVAAAMFAGYVVAPWHAWSAAHTGTQSSLHQARGCGRGGVRASPRATVVAPTASRFGDPQCGPHAGAGARGW